MLWSEGAGKGKRAEPSAGKERLWRPREEMAIVPRVGGVVKKRAEDRQDRQKQFQDGVVSLGVWLLQQSLDQTLLQCGRVGCEWGFPG